MTFHDTVVKLRDEEGLEWKQIGDRFKDYFPELELSKIMERCRNTYRGRTMGSMEVNEEKKEIKNPEKKETNFLELLKKGTTLSDMSDKCGLSESCCENIINDIMSQGYNVQWIGKEIKISNIIVPQENRIENKWNGEKVIRFGLMGDTQLNSKYAQITHLHEYYDICKREGIEVVYHTGDIDDGEHMRVGQEYEIYNQGADDHVEEIARVYPKVNGIETRFIIGNHDGAFIKRSGLDIGIKIAEKRSDLIYLGNSQATVNLTPNCTLELRHPIDGTAYALSYKLQKMIEAMSGGEKPNILGVGHYHKIEQIFYRNIHAFQTGCFQMQTPFTRGKGISVHMGGWIIEVHVQDDGTISWLNSILIPFYKEIKDDWKNWR